MSELTAELFRLIYLCSICLGIWTSLSLYLKSDGYILAHRLFATFVLLLLLPLVNGYAAFTSLDLPLLLTKIMFKFSWMYSPCLYVFVKLILNEPIKPYLYPLHFFPFIFLVVAILTGIYSESVFLVMGTFMQMGLYLSISAIALINRRKQILNLIKEYRNIAQYWCVFLIGVLFLSVIFELIVILSYLNEGYIDRLLWHSFMCLKAMLVYGIAVFYLCKPNWLSPKSTICNDTCKPEQVKTASATRKRDEKELKELDKSTARLLAEDLELYMKKRRPYLRNDLSLIQLAEALKLTPNQLSELLNSYLHVSFYEYLNNARVAEAVMLLKDPLCKLSVLEISYQAGFNNKNSFYRSFKQSQNCTPSEYRKMCRENQEHVSGLQTSHSV